MDDVAQNRGKDVLPQTSDQQNYIFHFHNLTANQEHDAKWHIPEGQNNRMYQISCAYSTTYILECAKVLLSLRFQC